MCILVAATLSFRALEVAWNNSVDLLSWSSVTFSVALIAAFMAVAYFAFLRRGAGPALAAEACAGVDIAQSFICAFKGVAILPSDLLARGTAADVSAGYDYVLTPAMLDAQGLLCIAHAILSLIRPPKLPVGGSMSTEASSVDMPKDLKAGSNAREDSSTTDAARPSLRMTIGSLINRDACPSSNTAMGAHTALGSHPTYYNNLAGALQRGSLAVSVLGGGTCNTEFEFLTGNSLGFIGGNKYPYTLYDFGNVASLPQQFKELGYTTTAMHPLNPENWNRSTVHQAMGFDKFLSDAEFSGQEGAWGLHAGLSDASTYDRIIQMLTENAEPQFIFDVTIQNHGGYDTIDIPEDYLVPGATNALAEDATLQTQATEYLGLINASDQALENFLTQLTQLDRKVAVVFFGDHQPGFTGAINDTIFPGEDELAHNTRLYETTYFTRTNYEVAGMDIDGVVDGIDGATADESAATDPYAYASVDDEWSWPTDTASTRPGAGAADATTWTTAGSSTLAAQLLDRIGAPLTLYQRAQLGATHEIAAVSLNGYLGADGA